MNDEVGEVLERLLREERERVQKAPPPPSPSQPMIHYSELPEDTSNGRTARLPARPQLTFPISSDGLGLDVRPNFRVR